MLLNNISLTTTCMDRNDFLEESLETWVQFDFGEIVIIDWSSKESLRDIVSKYPNKKIKLVEVKNEDYYHYSRARNFKVKMTELDYVMSIDCDVKLKKNLFDNIELKKDTFYTTVIDNPITGIIGTSIIPREMYFSVNGCNEKMSCWGSEDIDLYKRLIGNGFNRKMLNPLEVSHIEHGDELRIKNTKSKDKWRSNSKNNLIAELYENDTDLSQIIEDYEVTRI